MSWRENGFLKDFGRCPMEYVPTEHGPYNPARYYGKPDTAFLDVKIGDLGQWFMRRQKSPKKFLELCSRAYWRWNMAYLQPRYAGPAAYFQIIAASSVFFYYLNYKRIKHHKNYKYH